jgi:hypothetical protein
MAKAFAQRGEQFAIALITIGILSMVQPFVLALLAYGFMMVLVGMVLFMIVSHVK